MCIQHPCNMHGIRLLYNSDSLHCMWAQKTLSCALLIRNYYLPPLSQLRFLFTNELSASGIVVLCSDQKFINVSHEKIDIKIELWFFSKIESKSIETKRKQNCDYTSHYYVSAKNWRESSSVINYLQGPLKGADRQKCEILLFFSIPCQVNINELFHLYNKNTAYYLKA